MEIGVQTSGGFNNITAWLKQVSNSAPQTALNSIGREGVSRLQSATPRRTGATAAGWGYKISKSSRGWDIIWYNSAHPETSANVALLLQLGHGTGTGGYVPGQDYINPALRPVYTSATDKLMRELIK